MNRRPLLRLAAVAAGALVCGFALAQGAWPTKPVTLIVPNPPGGLVDTSARIVADTLQKVLNPTVVVDNRGGGSGNVAKSRADAAGIELRYQPSAQLDAMVKRETEFWARTIKAAGITAD